MRVLLHVSPHCTYQYQKLSYLAHDTMGPSIALRGTLRRPLRGALWRCGQGGSSTIVAREGEFVRNDTLSTLKARERARARVFIRNGTPQT